MILRVIEIFLHFDEYLQAIVDQYSALAYGLLFLIIFLETGIVATPFLPGDSLLFTAGALAAIGSLNVGALFLIILFAAILGDTANYHIGKFIGPKIFAKGSSLFFNKEYLTRAQKFYEKYGKKTIILARFVPIVRTFAPFVAGIGKMSYKIFLAYNVIGATLWCGLFIFGGFLFGNIPWIKENFGVIVVAIIFISLIPMFKEIAFHYLQKRK